MHPHHVYISYASPRVKSRGASSEEKKQEIREQNAKQKRAAYASLLAEKAEAEAKRREEQEAKRKEKRENTKKPLQLLNDEWFELEPANGYPLPSPAQHFSQRQPVTARILLQPKETDCTTTTKHGGAVVKSAGRNKGWPCRGSVTQDEADSLHVVHEEALDDAQREMSDFGEAIGSCLMCGRRDIGVIRDGAAAGTPTCTHCRQSPKTYCYSNGLSIAPPKNANWLGAPMTHARSLQLLKKLQGATHAELSLLRIATPLISAFRLKLGQFAFRKSAISLANPSLAKAPSLPRRPDDAGLNIISSSGGSVEAVSKDKQIYYNFRVRRSYVQDLLKLLIRDNRLYSDYTFDENDESWALLPEDGIPESIPIWEEAKPEDERRPIFEQGRSRRFARFDRFWS